MSSYITTESRNVISKQSRITGSKYIILAGKSFIESGAVIKGDASTDGKPVIGIGSYCYLDRNCSLLPPIKDEKAYPLKIGSFVFIGQDTKVNAASIADWVVIEEECEIGRFAVIKECVVIKRGAKIPPFAVIPPYTLVAPEDPDTDTFLITPGKDDLPGLDPLPAKTSTPIHTSTPIQQELPESAQHVIELYCRQRQAGLDVPLAF